MRASVSSLCAARSASAKGPRWRASIVARLGVAFLRRLRFALGGGKRLDRLGDGLSARRALRLLKARAC